MTKWGSTKNAKSLRELRIKCTILTTKREKTDVISIYVEKAFDKIQYLC